LDAALKEKVKRFHFVSTDEVFGALSLHSKDKFTEKTLYNPEVLILLLKLLLII
jgi:dTDP-glucose 4,6-dehydratase